MKVVLKVKFLSHKSQCMTLNNVHRPIVSGLLHNLVTLLSGWNAR
jgi:hypothetical protein